MISTWQTGGAVIRLFRASPAENGDELPAILTQTEIERSRRFHFERDRLLWMTGRSALRRWLADTIGTTPVEVPIETDDGGKPFVSGGPPFNLSHSGGYVAIAMGTRAPVGVDIEPQSREASMMEIAERYFVPGEREALRCCAGGERSRLFFRLWTAKEALMKATGLGMRLAPDQISVSLESGMPVRVSRLDTGGEWPVDCREVEGCSVSLVELV